MRVVIVRGSDGMQRVIRLLLILTFALAAGVASAQNIDRGRQLYQTHCQSCHGSNAAVGPPRAAANNPAVLTAQINTNSPMTFLRNVLSAQDIVDITAYIGSVVGGGVFQHVTGWYWNAAQAGRGYFYERTGDNVFVGGFYYETNGRALWFVAQGAMNGNQFSAPMLVLRGGPSLTGAYTAPSLLPSPGNITLDFTRPDAARMTWPDGTIELVRFPLTATGVGTPPAGWPQNGWWWNPAESGRGFAIEFQGNSVFIIGFMYDAQGNPIWYLSQGSMLTASRYEGTWIEFRNGQAIGQPYRAPERVVPDTGSLVIEFTDARNGTMIMPDGRRNPVTRFF
jgi:mono/diheme cytochrome c family protein